MCIYVCMCIYIYSIYIYTHICIDLSYKYIYDACRLFCLFNVISERLLLIKCVPPPSPFSPTDSLFPFMTLNNLSHCALLLHLCPPPFLSLHSSSTLFLLFAFLLSPRLRSVKMEQRKLHDQANTLVDLAKVSLLAVWPFFDFMQAWTENLFLLTSKPVQTRHVLVLGCVQVCNCSMRGRMQLLSSDPAEQSGGSKGRHECSLIWCGWHLHSSVYL